MANGGVQTVVVSALGQLYHLQTNDEGSLPWETVQKSTQRSLDFISSKTYNDTWCLEEITTFCPHQMDGSTGHTSVFLVSSHMNRCYMTS